MVKADEFTQSSLTDKIFSVVNLHMPSGFEGASVVPSGHKAGVGGLWLAKWLNRRKTAARRAVTSLKIQKCPA